MFPGPDSKPSRLHGLPVEQFLAACERSSVISSTAADMLIRATEGTLVGHEIAALHGRNKDKPVDAKQLFKRIESALGKHNEGHSFAEQPGGSVEVVSTYVGIDGVYRTLLRPHQMSPRTRAAYSAFNSLREMVPNAQIDGFNSKLEKADILGRRFGGQRVLMQEAIEHVEIGSTLLQIQEREISSWEYTEGRWKRKGAKILFWSIGIGKMNEEGEPEFTRSMVCIPDGGHSDDTYFDNSQGWETQYDDSAGLEAGRVLYVPAGELMRRTTAE